PFAGDSEGRFIGQTLWIERNDGSARMMNRADPSIFSPYDPLRPEGRRAGSDHRCSARRARWPIGWSGGPDRRRLRWIAPGAAGGEVEVLVQLVLVYGHEQGHCTSVHEPLQ